MDREYELQKKLVDAINDCIKKSAITDDDYYCVRYNERPEYGEPRMRDSWMISVYLNRSLPKLIGIESSDELMDQDDAKMIITSFDDLYAYNIEYQNGEFEIKEINQPIFDLEQELEKGKQAKK